MKPQITKADERGAIETDWLKARDSISIVDVASLEFAIKENSDILIIEVPLD